MVFELLSFTHLHRGNPPISNEKWIVTGWYQYMTKDIGVGNDMKLLHKDHPLIRTKTKFFDFDNPL